jgi:hypothetical protein
MEVGLEAHHTRDLASSAHRAGDIRGRADDAGVLASSTDVASSNNQ